MSDLADRYPLAVTLGGTEFQIDFLREPTDKAVVAFHQALPEHDLLFLDRDVREPRVLAAWQRRVEAGDIVSLAAWRQDELVGTTAIFRDPQSWSAHVGELRVLVAPALRETGLGRQLIQQSFLLGLDMGLEKLTVRMTLDQDRAMVVFEELGFRREAMFRDHVRDKYGDTHDLLVMSHDVPGFRSKMQALGLDAL